MDAKEGESEHFIVCGVGLGLGLTGVLHVVAKHNSRESCWVIINNVVYDVTCMIASNPPRYIKYIADREALFACSN